MSLVILAYTIREAAEALRLGPSMIRKLIREGRLHHVRIGRAVRIPASAVAALLAPGEPEPSRTDFGPPPRGLVR